MKCECYVIYHSSDFLKTASKCRKRSCGPYQKSRWVAVSWPVRSGWPQPCSVTSRAVPPPLRGRMTPSPRGHGFRCCSQVIQVTGWVRILGRFVFHAFSSTSTNPHPEVCSAEHFVRESVSLWRMSLYQGGLPVRSVL